MTEMGRNKGAITFPAVFSEIQLDTVMASFACATSKTDRPSASVVSSGMPFLAQAIEVRLSDHTLQTNGNNKAASIS